MTPDALQLGATLYLPCTRADLDPVLFDGRVPGLRSAVLCLEDSVLEAEVPAALANLTRFLRKLGGGSAPTPLLFVRPRGVSMLGRILRMPGAERLAGFVIPKATADTLPLYLALPFAPEHLLMPTLETRDAFDPQPMRRMREQLLAVQERILCLRIGGNDLLHTLGLRRSAVRTCYDGPLGAAIANLVGWFAPYGFALSAPGPHRAGRRVGPARTGRAAIRAWRLAGGGAEE
jgi:citrate lyase beta subunit